MYSLRLTCKPEEVDLLSSELWEAGTVGIREMDRDGESVLIAGFETNDRRAELLTQLARYSPEWRAEDAIDWAAVSRNSWQAREIGQKFLLAPPWSEAATPPGRLRLIHNPGLACGTGEHPCTQLALMALEKHVSPGCNAVDVGTGSGLLAIAALQLSAALAIGVDIDGSALRAARGNFDLNHLTAHLIRGSAECLTRAWSDVTVANISGTVLLSIWDDLLRITRRPGLLILTGFPEAESKVIERLLWNAEVTRLDGWHCLAAKLDSSSAPTDTPV